MNVRTSTSQFVASHGKQPRGRGLWCLHLRVGPATVEEFWHNGTLAEARKAAVAHVRATRPWAGSLVVEVQP